MSSVGLAMWRAAGSMVFVLSRLLLLLLLAIFFLSLWWLWKLPDTQIVISVDKNDIILTEERCSLNGCWKQKRKNWRKKNVKSGIRTHALYRLKYFTFHFMRQIFFFFLGMSKNLIEKWKHIAGMNFSYFINSF